MGQWILEMGTFLFQLLCVGVVVTIATIVILRARSAGRQGDSTRLRVTDLGRQHEQRTRKLRMSGMPARARRRLTRRIRRDERRRSRSGESSSRTTWVLDFQGNIKASGVTRLAQEISLLLPVVNKEDEVVVRLESPGGLVHAYGLAAAELDRLREAGVTTTVCVDKVAASGGYLMACNADRIRVAPFAVIGSIGVVAQVPNVHRLLKRHDIDVELHTAGRFKRTLTVLGENTEEGREKFREDLESTHDKFKHYVAARRPQLDIDAIATGEIWYGEEAVDKGLADDIGTSEAYLIEAMEKGRVMTVGLEPERTLPSRLGFGSLRLVDHLWERVEERLDAALWERR